jgi:putative phage-type endonuclease
MIDIAERCHIISAWPDAQSRDEWVQSRTKGLGGSDIGSILGVNKYKSALEVWVEKTGAVKAEEIDNEAIRWGNRLERPVAEEFAHRQNLAVVSWPVTLRMKLHEWAIANLDFLIVEPSDRFPAGQVTDWETTEVPPGIAAILEIKTSGIGSYGKPEEWGDDDNPTYPISYEYQCRHYSNVSGIREVYLVALVAGRGLTIRKLPVDAELSNYLFLRAEHFWTDCVLAENPPTPDHTDSAAEVLKTLYPKPVEEKEYEGGGSLDGLWSDLRQAKVDFDVAEKHKKELRNKIVALIGDAEYGTVYGNRVCSFKGGDSIEWFDEKSFARDNPKLYAQYRRTRPGHRSLREVKG